MTKINIICNSCGKDVPKPIAEITRQKKKGRDKFYCNLKCAGKNKKNIEHLKKFQNNFIDNRYTRQQDDDSNFKWYMKNVIKNSKQKKYNYDIDIEYLKTLWESQNGICPFTKQKLILRTHGYSFTKNPNQASLDRIDNSKGYIKGNIRFVSLIFNYAKNTFSDEDVLAFCMQVSKNKSCSTF